MKIASTVLVLLLSATRVVGQCEYCAYHPLTDTFTCAGTCTYSAGCTGCCILKPGVCYVGGCCNYVAGNGYICVDPSGDECGAQPCPGYTTPVSASVSSDPLPPDTLLVELSQRVALSTVTWIGDSNFPDVIGKFSNSFQKAVAAFQRIVADTPGYSMKEYDWRSFQMIVRPHFPVKVTISHTGADKWVIYLDRPDTGGEGPRAPSMLEIIGNQWKLISHQAMHAADKNNDKYVIASGTVQ